MVNGMVIWIVTEEDKSGLMSHFKGVFSTKEAAVAACANPDYSVMSAVVDKPSREYMILFPLRSLDVVREETLKATL